jgi:CBS domain-containing protein
MSPSPSDTVERLINGPAVEVHTDDTLTRIAELMVEDSIGLVVVRGEQPLVGVVSERDIVRAVAEGADLESDRAGDVMALETVSVASDATIAEAARMMIDGGMRHLPVLKNDRVVGVVSIRDLLSAHLD